MKKTIHLICFFIFSSINLFGQSFYELKWTASDNIKYTALIEYFDKETIKVRVKFTDKDGNYTVAKFTCKGEYYYTDGVKNYLFDGKNAVIVYPEYKASGYSADNFVFSGLDASNKFDKLYTYDDNDLADGKIDHLTVATFKKLNPKKDFTEKFVYNFFDKHEPEYNKYYSLFLGNHDLKNYYKLKLKNKCSKDIKTFIRYKNFEGQWKSKGWWKIKPGETVHVEDSKNNLFYFFAKSTDGSLVWKGKDNVKTFEGKEYGLREIKKKNNNYGDWVTNITCTSINPVDDSSISDIRLNLIFVADTNDGLGASMREDMNDVTNMLRKASKELGIKFNAIKIYGDNFDKSNVVNAINNLNVSKNDIIIFYYSGHGINNTSSYNKFPMMQLDGPDYGLEQVHNFLKRKEVRLTITIGDMCNSLPRKRSSKSETEIPFKSGYFFDTDKLRKLFVESRGDLISTSSKRGESSFCMRNSNGSLGNGYFTYAFINAFTKETSKINNTNGDWGSMFRKAYSEAARLSEKKHKQSDSNVWGQHGVNTNNIKN